MRRLQPPPPLLIPPLVSPLLARGQIIFRYTSPQRLGIGVSFSFFFLGWGGEEIEIWKQFGFSVGIRKLGVGWALLTISVFSFILVFRFSGSSDNEITVEEASFVHTEPPQDGSAPPLVSSAMEVLHDKVKKQVIKEGHGKRPLKFATCFGK